MHLEELCERIGIPREVTEEVLTVTDVDASVCRGLVCADTAQDAYRRLRERHPSGIVILAHSLRAALLSYDAYRARGIGDDVFFDTMRCFSRFLGETHRNRGVWDFDRGWWTYRQLSLTLFRLGELEYEYVDGDKTVSVHIPSDADISPAQCRSSSERYQAFTRRYFPEKSAYIPVCTSWLLSPALGELLPPSSRIRSFAACFRITSWDPTATDYLTWVFGRQTDDYAALPESTSLQRSVKRLLLDGGAVGTAHGILIGF